MNKSYNDILTSSGPLNGLVNIANSYTTQPRDHTSDFQSYPFDCKTSGLIYNGVPTLLKASRVCDDNYLPKPKSPNFKTPSAAKNILAGLISLCIILLSYMCFNAPAICNI